MTARAALKSSLMKNVMRSQPWKSCGNTINSMLKENSLLRGWRGALQIQGQESSITSLSIQLHAAQVRCIWCLPSIKVSIRNLRPSCLEVSRLSQDDCCFLAVNHIMLKVACARLRIWEKSEKCSCWNPLVVATQWVAFVSAISRHMFCIKFTGDPLHLLLQQWSNSGCAVYSTSSDIRWTRCTIWSRFGREDCWWLCSSTAEKQSSRGQR